MASFDEVSTYIATNFHRFAPMLSAVGGQRAYHVIVSDLARLGFQTTPQHVMRVLHQVLISGVLECDLNRPE